MADSQLHNNTAHRLNPTGGVFVGRQREMEELRAALEDAMSGRGRLVMLVGEPGIGKTRIAQELADIATSGDAQVLWGRCYEGEGTPPYWPWIQTMRSYVQPASAEQLITEMGPGAADIAEIVPEILRKLPDLETAPTLEPEAARFRLFDSITTFLKNAAQRQPLMLVLDDIHWADRSSLLLLEFLARELAESRLLLVGCYRDTELSRQHTLTETLAELSREPVFRRQVLRGLSQDDTGPFIAATTGVQLSQDMTDTLYSHTEGNPFFMTEVIRLMSESGELTAGRIGTPEGLRIPEGVRQVIGQRLNRLSVKCNEVLTSASIVGREFDFRLLNILSGGMSEDELLQALDEAVSFHLIEDMPGQMDRYQFSHALIQQTLAEELTTSRRVRLHARVAVGLEELYGDVVGAHAAELAHHFAEAQTSTGPAKLVTYSLLAGERALASLAYEDAISHFERGLIARDISLSGTEACSDEEAAALLFGLSRAQSAVLQRHQLQEVLAKLGRAFEYYAREGDTERAVAVAEYSITHGLAGQRTVESEITERALALVASDSIEAGRLLARRAWILGNREGDYEGAQDAYDRALAIARHAGDVDLEMRTLATGCWVDHFYLHWDDVLIKCERFAELAHRGAAFRWAVEAYAAAMTACCAIGDLEQAQYFAAASLEAAEGLRDRYWLATAFWRNETVNLLRGDWPTGRHFSDHGLALAPLDPRLLASRALLEYEVGEFSQGKEFLERLVDAMRLSPRGPTPGFARVAMVVPLTARVSSTVDRLGIAEEAVETVLSSPSATPNTRQAAQIGLALLKIQHDDSSGARLQHDALEAHRGTLLSGTLAADRLLGLLAHTMGNLDQSTTHFEDSLSFCRKAGYRPELAWTCCDYAGALKTRNSEGDRARAASLLEESLAISRELGMRPLWQRATDLQERVDAMPTGAPVYPDGLTHREAEVLSLVADGKSNADIAEELVISPNTVVRHVSNILAKTGSSNRTEAARYASQNGLAG